MKHSDIPRNSQFSNEAKRTLKEEKHTAGVDIGLAYLSTLFDSWDNFDDFQKMLKKAYGGVPKIVQDDRWMTDEVFASMFLNGCNPNTIQRCEKLPSNFPVTDDMVKSILDRGKTLEEEIKVTENNWYFCPDLENSMIFKEQSVRHAILSNCGHEQITSKLNET